MEIIATQMFVRSAKQIAKRYRSFNDDYQALLRELRENPHSGADLGGGFFKVRMAIKSKGKGKSGGARVITLDAIERNGNLYLLYAYDKSDYDSVKVDVLRGYARELGIVEE